MDKSIENFKLAVSVLTRFPVKNINMEKANWPESCAFFPICGYLVSVPVIIPGIILNYYNINISPLLLSCWTVFALIITTGAMHLDGLADICDGFGCHADKKKRLEIMHDPRVGTFGITGIFIILIAKIVSFSVIYQNNYLLQAGAVIVISRTIIVVTAFCSKPVENKGLGALILKKISLKTLYIALILTLPCLFINITVIIIMCISSFILIKKSYKLIDGINGDVIGAVCELSETLGLFTVALISCL